MPRGPASASQPKSVREAHQKFITGCHILHYHQILDAYGHLSVRHPSRPDIFIMARAVSPGTITSPDDLIEYHIEDASPVDPNAGFGYSERCIHSEILKAYPHVNAVIHSHSSAVVPFACSGVPMQPIYHMAGFLAETTPVWDIGKAYQQGDTQNMLVTNTRLGKSLAAEFGDQQGNEKTSVVLMRGHGFTVMAPSIEDCVLRAYYTQENARIATTAMLMRTSAASLGNAQPTTGLQFLSSQEREGAKEMTLDSCLRPWGLWKREVEANPMYENKA